MVLSHDTPMPYAYTKFIGLLVRHIINFEAGDRLHAKHYYFLSPFVFSMF